MVGAGMFDGLIQGLILIGIAIGVGLCAAAYGLYWLASHIRIEWIS